MNNPQSLDSDVVAIPQDSPINGKNSPSLPLIQPIRSSSKTKQKTILNSPLRPNTDIEPSTDPNHTPKKVAPPEIGTLEPLATERKLLKEPDQDEGFRSGDVQKSLSPADDPSEIALEPIQSVGAKSPNLSAGEPDSGIALKEEVSFKFPREKKLSTEAEIPEIH